MTDRIILNIRHSDSYTDYLLQTCWLRNHRIIPLVDPTGEELRAQTRPGTLVLHCFNSRREPAPGEQMVREVNFMIPPHHKRSIEVLSRCFLDDQGEINPTIAETARVQLEQILTNILYAKRNQQEVYNYYFPLLWEKRQLIYSNPNLFYVPGGQMNPWDSEFYPLGITLKTIEEGGEVFRYRHAGACRCECGPILTSYNARYESWSKKSWMLSTWCPSCGKRKAFTVDAFPARERADKFFRDIYFRYNMEALRTRRNIFDVIDYLSSTD